MNNILLLDTLWKKTFFLCKNVCCASKQYFASIVLPKEINEKIFEKKYCVIVIIFQGRIVKKIHKTNCLLILK